MTQPLTAMLSYSWKVGDVDELLHQELSLRGFTVLHDKCSFGAGSRVGQNMTNAVAICDGFLAYITPDYLYESAPLGTRRPTVDDELIPILDRLARAAGSEHVGRPVVLPLMHGLGERDDAGERVRKATGRDIASLWTPLILPDGTSALCQRDAAAATGMLMKACLGSTAALAVDLPLELTVATRGGAPVPSFLTIDATPLLGGTDSRSGAPVDWLRFFAGLKDVESALAGFSGSKNVDLKIDAHLSAAIAVGRVFNQAASWRLSVAGRHGVSVTSDVTEHRDLKCSLEIGRRGADLAVEIDVLGIRVADVAAPALALLPDPVPNRLSVWRTTNGDLAPETVGDMAAATAFAVRNAVSEVRPTRLHVFCAAPKELAVLLGHKLTSLHADIELYERSGPTYEPVLCISATTR